MMAEIVRLTEFEQGDFPSSFSVRMGESLVSPLPSVYHFSAEGLDGHYLLRHSGDRRGSLGSMRPAGNIGIAHEKGEAERRLYEAAKNLAVVLGKEEGVRDFADCTKYADEPLPRGGK